MTAIASVNSTIGSDAFTPGSSYITVKNIGGDAALNGTVPTYSQYRQAGRRLADSSA